MAGPDASGTIQPELSLSNTNMWLYWLMFMLAGAFVGWLTVQKEKAFAGKGPQLRGAAKHHTSKKKKSK